MAWRFPEVEFVKTNTVAQQIRHIASETVELVLAYIWYRLGLGKYERVLEEAADLYHSAESLWRVFLRNRIDIHREFNKVIEKNRERGYYRE